MGCHPDRQAWAVGPGDPHEFQQIQVQGVAPGSRLPLPSLQMRGCKDRVQPCWKKLEVTGGCQTALQEERSRQRRVGFIVLWLLNSMLWTRAYLTLLCHLCGSFQRFHSMQWNAASCSTVISWNFHVKEVAKQAPLSPFSPLLGWSQ